MTTQDYVPKVVRNEMFYAFARVCMIVATMVGLPLAGWMMNRIMLQVDDTSKAVVQQNVAVQVLTATVNDKLNSNFTTLTDHELRLRALENKH